MSTTNQELKRTPLFPVYQKYGAKTIDFGGWELPVQFTSILDEHQAVRTKAGLFDVSHMGEVLLKGEGAIDSLQYLMTNDIRRLSINQAMYTAMCYPDGGTIDDLLIYKLAEDEYLLVINASNINKDVKWIEEHVNSKTTVKNISSEVALLALQGPLAEAVLQKLTSVNLSEIGFFHFLPKVDISGIEVLVSRTGYTGEDGFELYLDAKDAESLWDKILEAGKEEGVLPCGLGARDTLRFEAKLPLYGQELSADISPLEAGIGFAVKVNKENDFIGKEALKEQKEKGLSRKLVGIEMVGRGIPRHGYAVYAIDKAEPIGFVTSGTHSPTLKKNLGFALIQAEYASVGTPVAVEIRNKRVEAVTVKTPFYKRT
ncbi:glycine cleavage system aminomethyltransferase GcvT [Thermoflavimicrobium daqui]|uniref:Aminomethyltransferase n=1 Tax=Thermoflavimicrobium daqui TaxID=2137476 RepID=A0A364K2R1_9BACL|nr:glycine cleavage system aminomethyltransferase GcvT [Thermoflavimicrobium daqui]RAL22705.1 glycine cleavage system aminomethyltransferase GcvT [Thermoflavimicrobium daqui]